MPATVVLLVGLLVSTAAAQASMHRPHWGVMATSAPTYFKPGDEGDYYEVTAVNDGDAPTDGSTFTVTEILPAGVTATAIVGEAVTGSQELLPEGMSCPTKERCESAVVVPVGEMVKLRIFVSVAAEASGVLHGSVTIAGGGADAATAVESTLVSDEAIPFGVSLTSDIAAEDAHVLQAGSHPVGFTTFMAFNVSAINKTVECELIQSLTPGCPLLNTNVKDLEVALPPGMVGDPNAVPRCSQIAFQSYNNNNCPGETQVGVMHLGFYGLGTAHQYAPVYNIEPPPGEAAELGFTVGGFYHIPIFFRVGSDGDYALTAQLSSISEADPVRFAALTVWGVPASSAHDSQRLGPEHSPCASGCASNLEPRPFLTLPTSCLGSEASVVVSGDSWQSPGALGHLPRLAEASIPAMSGCGALPFSPNVRVAPDTLQVGVPAGYSVKLGVPQAEGLETLASADVRSVELTLPPGTALSPSGANGLLACSEAEFELRSGVAGHCPRQSKIGQVSITTPLLALPLRGSVFLGTPECSPCGPADAEAGRMAPLLLEAEGYGIVIKLEGHTSLNQATGRLTTVFRETPQLPFSQLELTTKGGQDAPLVNPSTCGDVVAQARLTSWSSVTPSNITAPPMAIEGCTPPTFAPSLRAGATDTARAGSFTGFAVSLTRQDADQPFGRVSVTTPPGLLGLVKSVEQCPEANANAGTCSPASQIGTGSVTIGAGAQPLTVTGTKVFLTGPYNGRPFGLSIVTPAQAGPFLLAGNTGHGSEVVRAGISIDPSTSALTVTSDALPQALNGIGLNIRRIDFDIDRPGFIFNPTNCDFQTIAATLVSPTGMIANASHPFQASDCATLPFKPRLTASTHGVTSKAKGASLTVKVTARRGEANIHKVVLTLPLQLPARLSTLQKACAEAQFNANPAGCPAGAFIGTAKAVTPVLNVPLEGPAILVSHGGAAFPDVEFVLQGEGVTVILDGQTDIKKGITHSRFETVPDAPITSFETRLPQGSNSVLAASGKFCASTKKARVRKRVARRVHGRLRHVTRTVTETIPRPLAMPTTIIGQNGAQITQSTKINVTGCQQATKAMRVEKGA
ncbi:MAG TPA: hypothetical protein VFY36_06360 [Solirubrobacteraceae bacterium]|nr:hypothetical protein [Solirubrobacteraceae bacterium]